MICPCDACQGPERVNQAITRLLAILSPAQREEYEKRKAVTVVGSNGATYVVKCTTTVGNIYRQHNGYWKQFCSVPDNVLDMPRTATAMAQVVALRTDADALERKANPFGTLRTLPFP